MKKQKIYFLKGLPASGKSTWAKSFVGESGGRVKRVNKDELRAMVDGGKWSREREKMVDLVQRKLVVMYLEDRYDVVIDNTNYAPKHYAWACDIAKHYDAELIVKEFNVPLPELIRRDAHREKPVGEKVIYRMWDQYVRPKENPSRGDKKAIIVDVDGTLTTGPNDRSPYDWAKVGQDKVNIPVKNIVNMYADRDYHILVFTGRDGCCADLTKEWLKENDIPFEYFDIRPEGNTESDDIIKRRMFDKIKDEYDVELVLDDRESVVAMWRALGLKCLQCDWGIF